MKLRSLATLLAVGAIGLSQSSCFAVTDLDRFETRAGSTSNFTDLKLTMRGMTSHVAEYFEWRVIDGTNTLQSRGIILPLGGPNATLLAHGAIPKANGPFTLAFYADHNHDGIYTPPPPPVPGAAAEFPDHAWVLALDLTKENADGVLDVQFDHNTSFADLSKAPLEIGRPASVHLTNMGGLLSKRIEVRIADASSKRVVAFYRVPTIVQAAFDMQIPGMIDAGVIYSIEVYVDDGKDPAGAVQGFRFEKGSDSSGLDVTFDPGTAPRVTDVPPP